MISYFWEINARQKVYAWNGLYVFMTCKFHSACVWTFASVCVCVHPSVVALLDIALLQASDWQHVASVAENPWPSTLTFTLTAVSLLLIYCDANLILAPCTLSPSALTFSRLGEGSLGSSLHTYTGQPESFEKVMLLPRTCFVFKSIRF